MVLPHISSTGDMQISWPILSQLKVKQNVYAKFYGIWKDKLLGICLENTGCLYSLSQKNSATDELSIPFCAFDDSKRKK